MITTFFSIFLYLLEYILQDVEETEEELRGEMSDDLQLLDLEAGKWHNVTLKSEQQQTQAAAEGTDAKMEVKEEETVTGNNKNNMTNKDINTKIFFPWGRQKLQN